MGKERKNPHFDISASVIRQLGEELVSDEVTAMMELIKNSYDADADWVNVAINTKQKYINQSSYFKDHKSGYIIIEDNGFGMSDDDIWDYWMNISLSSKKKFKAEGKVTAKERTPLGEKGVGRLSTQKIGNRLELFTGKAGQDRLNHVAFDWSSFKDEISLSAVPVHIDSFAKKSTQNGTSLIISDLRDAQKWEGKSWDRFRGQISQMIFPFKDKRAFDVYLKLNGESIDLDELNKKVRKNAVSTYSFNVTEDKLIIKGTIKLQKLNGSNSKDAQLFYEKNILPDLGKYFFSFLTDDVNNKKNFLDDIQFSEKANILYSFKREILLENIDDLSWLSAEKEEVEKQKLKKENEKIKIEPFTLAHPGPFSGEIDDFYFQDSDLVTHAFSTFSEFKRIVQNQVGIRIFRDGFGIKPYGIDGYDWLNISQGQTSGGSFYGLRPGNIVGFVSITAKDNKELKEKTDREGFQDNPYSRNFLRLMNYVVDSISEILENTRRSYNDFKTHIGKQNSGVETIEDSFSNLLKTSTSAKKISAKSFVIKQVIAKATENIKVEKPNKLLSEITSTLQVTHGFVTQVDRLLEQIQKVDEYVKFIQPQITNLEQQLSDFSQLAGLGLTAEALSHELSNIVDRIVEETEQITKQIKGKDSIDSLNVNVYIEYIKSATQSFRKQLSHLAPSLKYVRESKEGISVKRLFNELKDFYFEKFSTKIDFTIIITGEDFIIKMNKGKLIQIFDNLILNSEYWLKERLKSHPRFKPAIFLEAKEPFIKIYDNGIGIESTIEERVFQPFVTAKPKKLGRGLGLFIVQQLLESEGCEIILLSERNNHSRRFTFQINLSSVIE